MGCALSSAEKEAVQRSLAIDKTLATEGATKQNEIKLLLLGELTLVRERLATFIASRQLPESRLTDYLRVRASVVACMCCVYEWS